MKLSRSLSFHDNVRLLRIIFFMLLFAQGVYFIIAWFVKDNIQNDPEINKLFYYIVPVIIFLSIFASRILYKILVRKALRASFVKKLESYRTGIIAGLAVLEGANIIAITAFLITGDYIFAVLSAIIFLLFVINVPTEYRFKTDLELTPEELSLTE